MTLIFLGLLTGLDNFILSSGFGALRLKRIQMVAMIAAFALFEALMPLVGFGMIGRVDMATLDWLAPVFLISAGLFIWGRVICNAPVRNPHFALLLAPLVLSLDNLAAGAGMGVVGGFTVSAVLATGMMAAAISLAGFALGRMATAALRFNPQIALAVSLLMVGTLDLAGTL